MTKQLNELLKLSVPERILIVEAIWDSIAAEEGSYILTEEHKKILNERLEEYKKTKSGSTFQEIKKRIHKIK